MLNRTRSVVIVIVLMLFVLLGSLPANAQSGMYTPKPGSFERKLLMDTLRVPIEARLHKPVIFQVTALRVKSGWAFMTAIPVQPNGKPLNWTGTPYAKDARIGVAFSGSLSALLHKTRGKWHVVTYNIGASDVNWYDWDKRYGAPHAILGLP